MKIKIKKSVLVECVKQILKENEDFTHVEFDKSKSPQPYEVSAHRIRDKYPNAYREMVQMIKQNRKEDQQEAGKSKLTMINGGKLKLSFENGTFMIYQFSQQNGQLTMNSLYNGNKQESHAVWNGSAWDIQ